MEDTNQLFSWSKNDWITCDKKDETQVGLGLENILLQNLLFCKLQSVQYLNRVYILVIIIIFFFMQKIQGTQIMVKYHKGIRFIAKGYMKISRK